MPPLQPPRRQPPAKEAGVSDDQVHHNGAWELSVSMPGDTVLYEGGRLEEDDGGEGQQRAVG